VGDFSITPSSPRGAMVLLPAPAGPPRNDQFALRVVVVVGWLGHFASKLYTSMFVSAFLSALE
jgi:hypothetical protein